MSRVELHIVVEAFVEPAVAARPTDLYLLAQSWASFILRR
jgi:hypothetical protein